MPTPTPFPAAISLGSNLGDRHHHLRVALDALSRLPHTTLIATSAIIETAPVGGPAQGPYLNAACALSTSLSPRELLDSLLAIERQAGRDRSREERWGPRTLDLDLLLYGSLRVDETGLMIPHPRMHERRFVLVPLAQVAADWRVPGVGATVAELLRRLPPGAG